MLHTIDLLCVVSISIDFIDAGGHLEETAERHRITDEFAINHAAVVVSRTDFVGGECRPDRVQRVPAMDCVFG